jgi:hypothetical protein
LLTARVRPSGRATDRFGASVPNTNPSTEVHAQPGASFGATAADGDGAAVAGAVAATLAGGLIGAGPHPAAEAASASTSTPTATRRLCMVRSSMRARSGVARVAALGRCGGSV